MTAENSPVPIDDQLDGRDVSHMFPADYQQTLDAYNDVMNGPAGDIAGETLDERLKGKIAASTGLAAARGALDRSRQTKPELDGVDTSDLVEPGTPLERFTASRREQGKH